MVLKNFGRLALECVAYPKIHIHTYIHIGIYVHRYYVLYENSFSKALRDHDAKRLSTFRSAIDSDFGFDFFVNLSGRKHLSCSLLHCALCLYLSLNVATFALLTIAWTPYWIYACIHVCMYVCKSILVSERNCFSHPSWAKRCKHFWTAIILPLSAATCTV